MRRAIESALVQTYENTEVLVSDDASTDDTCEQIQTIHDSRLKMYGREQRLGLVRNFDFCLRHAKGEFFLLLGDDDVLERTAIERLAKPFLSPRGDSVGMTWCPCHIVDANGVLLWDTDAGPERESPESLICALWAGKRGPRLSSIMLRTDEAVRLGGFQDRYGDLCDIGLWAAVALLHPSVACVQHKLVRYTNHHGSTTSQSACSQWQNWARVVHNDLLAVASEHRPADAIKRLSLAKKNFLAGVTLTILIQTIGKKNWIWNGFREAFRNPSVFLTPYFFKRLFKDGWKVASLNLKRQNKEAHPLWTKNSQVPH